MIVINQHSLFVKMQISVLERSFDQECKSLKSQVYELEKKLEGYREDLSAAESTLSCKDSELVALQSNLRELEELREMKEVIILSYTLFSLYDTL